MPGSEVRVDIVRPADAAWDEWLGRVPRDVFHTAGYHAYSQASGEGEAYLIVVGDADRGVAWPYLLRSLDGQPGGAGSGLSDVSSVYGYPGPLAWGCTAGDAFIVVAWREILAAWRAQGVVTAFTRFHPLLGNASLASGLRSFDPGIPMAEGPGLNNPIVAGGQTVSIDLSLGYDGVRAQYGRDLRREIDASRRGGLVTSVDEDFTELAKFASLYNDTMARLNASDFYLFQESDFWRLRESLDGRLHLLLTRIEGEVAAAGLFTEWHGLVEWYLVGTDSAYSNVSPSKPLVDFAVEWAIGLGANVLHLGGGRGGSRDSLLWFKGRFSPRRHTFHTGRWVLNPDAATALADARRMGLLTGTILSPGYFPAYRAPAIEVAEGEAVVAATRAGASGAEAPGVVDVRATGRAGRAGALEISRVGAEDAPALAELLVNIDGTYFQPHPMNASEAQRISTLRGRDIYLMGRAGRMGVAYGMLRGFDEGYGVPSLGLGVRRDQEGQGFGRAMLTALHDAARLAGATRVRLRVHPDNTRAAILYRSVGYREVGMERNEILMMLDLPPA